MTLLIEASLAGRPEPPSSDVLNKKEMEIVDRFVKTGIPEYIRLSRVFSNEWLAMNRIMTADENKYAPRMSEPVEDKDESDPDKRPPLIIWLQNLHKKFEHLPLPSTLFEASAEKEYGIEPRKQRPITATDGKKYDVAPSTILDAARDYLAMAEREEPWKETTGERSLKKRDKTIANIGYFAGKVEDNEGYSAEVKNNLGDLKKISGELGQIRVIGSIYEHLKEPRKFSDNVTQAQYNGILDNLETRVGRLVVTPEGVPKGQEELLAEIDSLYLELRSFNKDNTKQKDERLNELNAEVKDLFVVSKRYQTFFMGAFKRYGVRWDGKTLQKIQDSLKGLDWSISRFSELMADHKKSDKILELTKDKLHSDFSFALKLLKDALRQPFQDEKENFFDAEYKEFKDLFGDNLLGAEELKSAFTGLESHTFERKYTKRRYRIKGGNPHVGVDHQDGEFNEPYDETVREQVEGASAFMADTDRKGEWKEVQDERIHLQLEISEQDEQRIKEKLFDFYLEPDIYDFVQQVKAGLADPKDWVLFAVAPQKNFEWDISESKKRTLAEKNKSSRDDGFKEPHPLYLASRTEAFYLNNFVNVSQRAKGEFHWRLMPTKPTRDYAIDAELRLDDLNIGKPTITEKIAGEPREAEFLDSSKRRLADIFEIQQYQFMKMRQQGVNVIEGHDLGSFLSGKDKPTLAVSTNGIKPGQLSYYEDHSGIKPDHRVNMMGRTFGGELTQRDFAVASIAYLQRSISTQSEKVNDSYSKKSERAVWIASGKTQFDRELPKMVARGYNVR